MYVVEILWDVLNVLKFFRIGRRSIIVHDNDTILTCDLLNEGRNEVNNDII